jgi:precorrin-6A/cobalt-precorrin-6A reductase
MPAIRRLLILGGTAEAAALARRAVDSFPGTLDVVTSLAGRLKQHGELPGTVRVGGFGGIDGLATYLRQAPVDWLIDATHPFAENISSNAYAACLRVEVPRLMLVRPPWPPPPGTKWLEMENMAAAAAIMPKVARRAFLTVGAGGLKAFHDVAGVWFLVRLVEPPEDPLPLAQHEVVVARPPFTLEGERALLEEHDIDTLVARQSGGAATVAKLTAARELGLKVVLIARPPPEPGQSVETVEEALGWLESQL